MTDSNLNTPMMQQYLEIKKNYPNDVLFFRMGDFYEMFLDDAIYASRILDIALTKRQDKIPMCGIPHHAWQNYVHRILNDGKKIAICEQIEDPKNATGKIVKRAVTRVLTPGSIFEEELLDENWKRNLGVLYENENSLVYLSADLSTGTILADRVYQYNEIPDKISLYSSGELLIVNTSVQEKNSEWNIPITYRKYPEISENDLRKSFIENLGLSNPEIIEADEFEKKALFYLFLYIHEISPTSQISWKLPMKIFQEKYLILDQTALKTLEVLTGIDGDKKSSLFSVMNRVSTTHGKRMLAEYLSMPSSDIQVIQNRQLLVEWLYKNNLYRKTLETNLKNLHDMERIIVALANKPVVRHLGQIRDSLNSIYSIHESINSIHEIKSIPSEIQENWIQNFQFPYELRNSLNEALLDDLPPLLDERPFLQKGFSEVLDDLMEINHNAFSILKKFEEEQRKKYDISTLKVKYNKVIGYYIEISKGQSAKAPNHYIRRQTLVNGERYTCEDLKNIENQILNAKENIISLQKNIFQSFVLDILDEKESLRKWSLETAQLDVANSFAEIAKIRNYTRPVFNTKGYFNVKNSRHPVIEERFKGEIFVPNDIHLKKTDSHLAIITGPNMSGKSTYIRQTGIISILAQAGSFVPAESADLPIIDRIFTRIGAYDRLHKGESTFYVEMKECAGIFHYLSPSSLILLDEVGRGTSTYDGISIARAMIEYLNSETRGRPITLFATHYGELADMINRKNGIIGLTVSVLEEKEKITFLRKIKEGIADKSYGIYVARLAGLPKEITTKAEIYLKELEEKGFWDKEKMKKSRKLDKEYPKQLDIFNDPAYKQKNKEPKG